MKKFFSNAKVQGAILVAVTAGVAALAGGPVVGLMSVVVCLWLIS